MNYIQTLASTLVFLKRILIYKLWLHHALRKNKKRFFTSTVTTLVLGPCLSPRNILSKVLYSNTVNPIMPTVWLF